jgi:hypothetical protein
VLPGFGAIPSFPAIPGTPYGSFGATSVRSVLGSHPATTWTRGFDYRNPNDRLVVVSTSIEMFNLPTLPERMHDHLQRALRFHLKDAAERVITTAQQSLTPGHGYDTGRMRDSLTYALAEHLLETGVYYDLFSEVAHYWRWVEFGHWMVNGEFWPGYHFLENAMRTHEGFIRSTVREAWQDTATALAAESRAAT